MSDPTSFKHHAVTDPLAQTYVDVQSAAWDVAPRDSEELDRALSRAAADGARAWSGVAIDPVALGGPEWDRFADCFNEFCVARGGKPLPNQTPRLTGEQMRAAFGARVERFNERRRRRRAQRAPRA